MYLYNTQLKFQRCVIAFLDKTETFEAFLFYNNFSFNFSNNTEYYLQKCTWPCVKVFTTDSYSGQETSFTNPYTTVQNNMVYALTGASHNPPVCH